MINRHHYVARQPVGSNSAQNKCENLFHEWQLLVYEESFPSEGKVSQDIRDLIERFPFSREISVIAPNCDEQMLWQLLNQGTASFRTQHQNIELSVICFDKNLQSLRRQIVNADSNLNLTIDLPIELQNAWLFDLFHRHHCLVPAPEGVHFGKTSGKHSNKFLRAANVLVGSLEASLLAFFLLPFSSKLQPQIIHVDTGPLVSVALALIAQLRRRNLWSNSVTIESFSSYDGISNLTTYHKDNLFLISASTSGGLKNEIIKKIGDSKNIATIFYLQATNQAICDSYILCDLNENEYSYYGYPKVETYLDSQTCKWCISGIPFAEFEGDQFLLQKRKTQFINIAFNGAEISKCSLQADARDFFLKSKSHNIFYVQLTKGGSDGYRDVRISEANLHKTFLSKSSQYKDRISDLIASSTINYIVTESFNKNCLKKLWSFENSAAPTFKVFTSLKSLQEMEVLDGASVLVAFDAVISILDPRKISEILRSITPNGTISYFSAATIVESCEQFSQLSAALRTGAKGFGTHRCAHGYVLFLRKRHEARTSWDKEKEFLEKIVARDDSQDNPTFQEISDRVSFLRRSGEVTDNLFWTTQNGKQLKLQPDFVFLPVDGDESQADVYAIVSNLLSTAVQNNRNPENKSKTNEIRRILRDSIYSEALIDPNNFLKFNDAILRASILRAATSFELNYSRELYLSSILTNLIQHEISEWRFSRGQCLMEFLIALATKHLSLCTQHLDDIILNIDASSHLPAYVKRIGCAIKEVAVTSPTPSPA